MKKSVKISVLLVIVIIAGLVYSGCNKYNMTDGITDNDSFETNIVEETQVVDNSVFDYSILKYKSKSSFLKGLDSDKKSVGDFYSLFDYYFDAQKIFDSLGVVGLNENNFDLSYFDYDTSGIFELNIFDIELAKLLSPQGYIQIGDTIMKVNAENVIFISNSDYLSVPLVEKNDFESDNIDVVNNQKYTQDMQERYYDNGWNEGCHRILVKRWSRQYRFYVRAGASISYYTRIYKREWLFGPKRLVWQKKDNGFLTFNASCDSMMTVALKGDWSRDTTYYWSNAIYPISLFSVSKTSNFISFSENPINFSLPFFGSSEVVYFKIFGYNLNYSTPIKTGNL